MIRYKNIILLAVLLAGGVFCVLDALNAYRVNGFNGFPLDDPWIHLQFAKNLHDYGSFSYYKNEMMTSGSTSPLYTMLLAVGFFFTSNEMIMSYCFGIAFFVLAALFMFKNAILDFGENILFAAVAVGLLLFESRLQWIALSGMETTLFIFLLLVCLYFYKSRNGIFLGVAAGLLVWTRPEAVLFIAILLGDTMYHSWIEKRNQPKKRGHVEAARSYSWLKSPMLIFVFFATAYVAFNLLLSGSILPNTFSAKTRYYSSGGPEFPGKVFHYLFDGHMIVLAIFVVVGIVSVVIQVLRRRQAPFLIPLLWSLGMFLAYWKSLPYLYQEGRYLMPILPFVLLLGLHGIQTSIEFLGKKFSNPVKPSLAASFIILGIISGQFAVAAWANRASYADYCKYIGERQVRTARWLHDHLPDNAVIATHDIGAIAFYSQRRIVDMVGLVSPEMINNIGSYDRLREFLIKKKATHIATLRNWFAVVNVNPIFKTDERTPEIMEVFEMDPRRVWFTSQDASEMTDAAGYYLSIGNVQQAGSILQQSIRIDPQSSKTHLYLGRALMMIGQLEKARAAVENALKLHPTYWDAQLTLAEIAEKNNQPQQAITQLESLVQTNPHYAEGYRALAHVYLTMHTDSLKANEYLQRYNRLSQEDSR